MALKGLTYSPVPGVIVSAATSSLNLATVRNGGSASIVLDSSPTALTFPTVPNNVYFKFYLTVIQKSPIGFYTVSFPASVVWVGSPPVNPATTFVNPGIFPVASSTFATYQFETTNGGTTWYASQIGKLKDVLAYDTFTRANSTSTLSTTQDITPKTWTILNTATWGITSNAAYCPTLPVSANGSIASVNVGTTQQDVRVRMSQPTASAAVGLACRVVDGANYFLVQYSTSAVDMFSCVAGVFTNRYSAAFTPSASGNNVRLVNIGRFVYLYIDDVLRTTYELTQSVTPGPTDETGALATGNSCGLRVAPAPYGSATTTWDNFFAVSSNV
jgi:hypothetical protein